MLTILLVIMISKDLAFAGLTTSTLLAWFNLHPIIALIAILDLCTGVGLLSNLLTSLILSLTYANSDNCDCLEHSYAFDIDENSSN